MESLLPQGLGPNPQSEDIYDPLPIGSKEIRILLLHAGVGDLRCTLLTTVLFDDDPPEYETISYTWGDPRDREPISINDRYLNVPTNTAKALRCARSLSEDRVVWIDAICINQDDLDERNDQVSMMSSIYRCSQCNLIYLGDDGDKATQAFTSIEALASEAEAEMSGRNMSLGDITFPNGYFAFSDVPLRHKPDMSALGWFYQLPWFGRLWVLQEAVLSTKSVALCGDRAIDFERIQIATAWLEHKTFVVDQSRVPLLTLPGFRGANNMWLLRKGMVRCQYAFLHPFSALLGFSPFGDATDVRDQVYGLLGLYQSCGGRVPLPRALQPDYRKSISSVLRDATRYAIEEERRLSILERLPLQRENRPEGLPSWVSEWFRYHQPSDARALTNTSRACGPLVKWRFTDTQPTSNLDILRITGIAVDTVNEASEAITYRILVDARLLHAELTAWQEMASATGQSTEAIGMTVLGGKWWTDAQATRDNASLWHAFVAYLQELRDLLPEPATISASARTEESGVTGFYLQLRNTCHGRCFFTTKSGYIGVGPSKLRSGDTVAILQGGHLPFILRQEESHCKLLGPAYVHGLMLGEAVDEHERSGRSTKIFDIK